ncbi:polyketide synthase [Calothrix sp. CCY 0018]|uniref:polyketide synthase n=1 Tax=Calothrix sp. CCY 0018 TaxID=3103864 RepID=UPI0039C661BC
MVNIKNQNHKLAIIGININGGSLVELDNFERTIYQGKQYNISPDSNLNINEIVNKALKDAEVESNAKIAVIIVSDEDNTANLPFTHTATSKTVFSAIQMAQKLLAVKEVDTVAIASVASPNSPALNGGLVLIDAESITNNQRIYAIIDAVTIPQNSSPKAQTITQTCQQAFNIAGIKAEDIGYLEICGSCISEPNQLEIKELVAAYQTSASELNCAVGSLKTNIGNDVSSEMGSLIKTALCLYYRYIPAVPEWSNPKYPELWQGSSFYVQTQSKPWFLAAETNKRIAAINGFSNGNIAHLILSESPLVQERDSRYLAQMPILLFPLAADDLTTLIEQIKVLETKISQSDSLAVAAAQTFATYLSDQNATYAVGILGRNLKELQRETQRAIKGIEKAFETGGEWKTPVGSYFTAKPLGKKSKVAFVYPGAYSSYLGIARNLFRLFPKIWDSPVIQSVYSRVAGIEKFVYPRSLNALTKRQLEVLEQELIDNPLSMLESEVGIAGLMSAVLRDYFGLQPDCCFGYSVGETTMAIAQGIWTDFSSISSGLNSSQLFNSRLCGAKNAVREYWRLTDAETKSDFWRNYVLMAGVSEVKEQLKKESRVYLTQINTPREVVIAGDIAACQRVIASLGCNAIAAPFNHAIHCEAMASEYDEFVKLHTLPINNQPQIEFYSAAEYETFKPDSEVMGHNIAKVLCEQFDFPRIVNRLYEAKARIFVEVGAGNACSRWIGENLKGREHTTISLNRRGIDEYTSLLRGLAQLLSQRVEIDLSPLYNLNYLVNDLESKASSPEVREVQKTVPQSTSPKSEFTLNNQNQNQNKNHEVMVTLSPHYWSNFSMQELQTSANSSKDIEVLHFANPQLNTASSNENIANFKAPSTLINKKLNSTSTSNKKLSGLINSHAKAISETDRQSSQSQAIFLQARQSSFNQMVNMVELHLSMLNQQIK